MSEDAPTWMGGELRLAPESIEALARRLAELLAAERRPPSHQRHLTAAEVSEWWGVDRAWVYAHADELGAKRLGAGKRPRLRFDAEEVASRIDNLAPPGEPDRGGFPASSAAPGSGSLESPSRAMVAARRKRAGRRGAVAGQAPKHGRPEW